MRSVRLLVLCLLSEAIILSAWATDQSIYNTSFSEDYLGILANSYSVQLANQSQIKSLDSYSSSLDSNNYFNYLIKKEGPHGKENGPPHYPDPVIRVDGSPFNDNIVSVRNIQLLNQEASSLAGSSQYYLYEDGISTAGFQARKQNSGKASRIQDYAYEASRSSEIALNALRQEYAPGTNYYSNSYQAYSFDASEIDATLKYTYEKNPSIGNSMSGFATVSPAILPETDLKLRYLLEGTPHQGGVEDDIQTVNSNFKLETSSKLDHVRDSRAIQYNDNVGRSIIADHELLSVLASSTNSSDNGIDASYAYNSSILALNRFYQNSITSYGIWQYAPNIASSSNMIRYLGPPILAQSGIPENVRPPTITPSSDYFRMLRQVPLDESKGSSEKNYAIIVGINSYNDRIGLQTCVNDANLIASILESYGYVILKLTDETAYKPTKHNIDDALTEIKLKQNRGKVIFYFSGHGLLDAEGNFYLVPLDANGASSSYISEEDFRQYARDIKNLAIIIDACNSGALCDITDDGQLIIASSREQEPSNEEWTGSLSVFTGNLCDAISEESKKGGKILLQDCFSAAYYTTVDWSKKHQFIDQTPIIEDKTSSRRYYLN